MELCFTAETVFIKPLFFSLVNRNAVLVLLRTETAKTQLSFQLLDFSRFFLMAEIQY